MIRELEFRVSMMPLHIITIILNSIGLFDAIENQNIVLAIVFIISMTTMIILYSRNLSRCNSIIKYQQEVEELAIIENYKTEQKTRD